MKLDEGQLARVEGGRWTGGQLGWAGGKREVASIQCHSNRNVTCSMATNLLHVQARCKLCKLFTFIGYKKANSNGRNISHFPHFHHSLDGNVKTYAVNNEQWARWWTCNMPQKATPPDCPSLSYPHPSITSISLWNSRNFSVKIKFPCNDWEKQK